MPGFSTILLGLALLILIVLLLKKSKKTSGNSDTEVTEPTTKKPIDFTTAYASRWLFSYNEKDAFQKLKEITDKKGFTLLAKVRLLDLIEPQKGHPQYKTLFYKVQAKHVDFVVCDAKLVARYIIELDDSSHDKADRQKRDAFVDTVLISTGYKILHTRVIDIKEIESFLS